MRALPLLFLASVALAVPAKAQVSLNLDALNPPAAGKPPPTKRAEPPARPARPRVAKPPAPRPAAKPAAPTQAGPSAPVPKAAPAPKSNAIAKPAPTPAAPSPAGASPAPLAVAPAAAAAALALPEKPPAAPVLATPAPAPKSTASSPPPPHPVTSATAGSTVAATPQGLRVNFAVGKSDLTPESAASLSNFAKQAPTGDMVTFNVQAYASGKIEDPSTTRRLALERALTIRGALMADGVASTRIFVRAMGAPTLTDDGPADRVDIAVLGASAPSMQSGTQSGAPARP